MHLIWEQHVSWTRMTIMCIVFDLSDVEAVTARLIRNPTDMGRVFRRYYGDQIALKLRDLFTEHLTIAAELVNSVKVGDNVKAEDANRRWYSNADEIARFLAQINPYWSEGLWRRMLHEHLRLTSDEAVTMLNRDYDGDIKLYDEIELQALTMADEMTRGIVIQFPGEL
ncbi:MAG TPA: acetylglutamate kinase [Thermoanaerobacterales bacterium]|nr:acetylglutamate kinase [Thermoanaerobacterales bacterium]